MTNDTQPKAKRFVAGLLIGLGLVIGAGVTMDHHSAVTASIGNSGPGHGGSWNGHLPGK